MGKPSVSVSCPSALQQILLRTVLSCTNRDSERGVLYLRFCETSSMELHFAARNQVGVLGSEEANQKIVMLA